MLTFHHIVGSSFVHLFCLSFIIYGEPDSLGTLPTKPDTVDKLIVVGNAGKQKQDIRSLGSQSFSGKTIKATAGSANDISRFLSLMPSVVSSLGDNFDNTLYVRGGGPSEIIFLVDGIELENINHFSSADGCGGPVGFLNADFIKNARFFMADIPVSYPGKLSSVVDITMRSGSFLQWQGDAGITLTGGSASAEGPLSGTNGSVALAGRYIDFSSLRSFIKNQGIPSLGDGFAKALFLLDRNTVLSATGLMSYNTYRYKYDYFSQQDSTATFPNIMHENKTLLQAGIGFSFHHKTPDAEHTIVASYSTRQWNAHDSLANFADTFFTHRYAQNPISGEKDSRSHYTIHTSSILPITKNQTVSAGIRANENKYEFGVADQTQKNGICIVCQNDSAVKIPISQSPVNKSVRLSATELGFYLDHTVSIGKWQNAIGFRADYFALLNKTTFSPRIFQRVLLGAMGTLSAGAGIYNQFPNELPGILSGYLSPLPSLSADSVQKTIDMLMQQAQPLRCYQGSLGYEETIAKAVKFQLGLYYKWYDREYHFLSPQYADFIHSDENGDIALQTQDGIKKAYGAELSLKNSPSSWYFYAIGLSIFDVKNRFENAQWYNDWTNVGFTYSLSLGATFAKYNNFSISIRGSGGRPYCAQAVRQDCIGRKSAVIDNSIPYFAERLQYLSSTNVRYGITRKLLGITVESSIEVLNLFNYQPVLEYKFNGNGFTEITPFGIMPIIGFSVHF